MSDPKQMSMEDILADELPPREEAPKAEEPPKTEAAPEAPPEKPEPSSEPKVRSRRKEWQDREMDARGLRRDPETGQFVPKEPAEAEKPAEAAQAATEKPAEPEKPAAVQQEMSDKEKAFLRAMQEERQKRQELERRLQAIEAARTQQTAPPQPAEAPKTFWDDPEGFLARHNEQVKRESINTRLQISETLARKTHNDFDAKVEVFGQLIQTTPGLRERWLASSDPAEFAYTVARNHMELQEAGNIDALREKIAKETETRVRAQIEAELKAKAEALAKERAALPPSLSEARTTGQPNRPVWNGPTSMDEILGG